jgi:hypothetical protein
VPTSPIQEVKFGTALKISLDNYYDLLKEQIGKLNAEEYLQLKLVADSIDISDKDFKDKGYKWFSYYNLLRRADREIDPTPVEGTINASGADLTQVYGSFLRRVRRYVVMKNLSPQEQQLVADCDTLLDSLKIQIDDLAIRDRARWKQVAAAMGYSETDMAAYIQWSSKSGSLRKIEAKIREIADAEFRKKGILDRQYPEASDREIVDTEFAFEDPSMRLRYPIHPDYEYDGGANFSLQYLALLPLGSTALFDDRRVYAYDKTLTYIMSSGAGSFTATLDSSTTESKSIETDWSAGGSASYGLFSVKASASEHKKIAEDFFKGRTVTLSSKAAFKVKINYPGWFNANLFKNKRVLENIRDFEDFFGPKGSLLYFPTELVIVRGFGTEFISSQQWTYDYVRNFSASGGGGFGIGGISFGASASYSSTQKEHTVDQSGTTLKIADDPTTLRFVGFVVKKNDIYPHAVLASSQALLSQALYATLV